MEEVPREEERALGYVILTDSNGRGMKPTNIKAHIPGDQRERFDIRVETVYTLVEACNKLERGVWVLMVGWSSSTSAPTMCEEPLGSHGRGQMRWAGDLRGWRGFCLRKEQ